MVVLVKFSSKPKMWFYIKYIVKYFSDRPFFNINIVLFVVLRKDYDSTVDLTEIYVLDTKFVSLFTINCMHRFLSNSFSTKQ